MPHGVKFKRSSEPERLAQAKEDEEVGLTSKSRTWSEIQERTCPERKSAAKPQIPAKKQHSTKATDEDTDEETVVVSKRLRMESSGTLARTNRGNIGTTL